MNYMHMGPFSNDWGVGLGIPLVISFVFVAFIWSILWKGLALWRSAKRGDMWWFIAFLLINTLGILEIIYLFAVTGAKISDFTGGMRKNEQPQNPQQ